MVTGPEAALSGELDADALTPVLIGKTVPLPVGPPLVPLPGAGNGAPEG